MTAESRPSDNTAAPVRQTPWRRRLGIAVVAAAMLLVAADITLRLGWGFGRPLIYAADPDCGYLPAPGQVFHRFGALNSINSMGMRCPEFSAHKPPGVTRVLLVGDSVTYGTPHVDQSKIFSSLLQQDLPGVVGGPVQVLNASAGGWAVFNETAFLRSRGTLDADLVIFINNTRDLSQPFNRLDMMAGNPTRRPVCALAEAAQMSWQYVIAPRLFGAPPVGDPGSVGDAAIDPAREVPPVLAALDEARTIAQHAGARFAVVFTPDYLLANRPDWSQARQMLIDWAAARRVPLLDMTTDFISPATGLIYLDNLHLAPLGHKLIAQKIIAHWARLTAR